MTQADSPYTLVVGLGTSGLAMARFLRARGESVVATDIDEARMPLTPQLHELGIRTEIGFHDQSTFNKAHTIIPSPGIPREQPLHS